MFLKQFKDFKKMSISETYFKTIGTESHSVPVRNFLTSCKGLSSLWAHLS